MEEPSHKEGAPRQGRQTQSQCRRRLGLPEKRIGGAQKKENERNKRTKGEADRAKMKEEILREIMMSMGDAWKRASNGRVARVHSNFRNYYFGTVRNS